VADGRDYGVWARWSGQKREIFASTCLGVGSEKIFVAPPNAVHHSAVEALIATGVERDSLTEGDGDASGAESTDANR